MDVFSKSDTMADLGGLTTKKQYLMLSGDAATKKFNASGTVTAGDALANAGTVIQMNTNSLNSFTSRNQTISGGLVQGVLAHEFGHFLGLKHDNNDSLMTENIFDTDFTGQVSTTDANQAAKTVLTLWNS